MEISSSAADSASVSSLSAAAPMPPPTALPEMLVDKGAKFSCVCVCACACSDCLALYKKCDCVRGSHSGGNASPAMPRAPDALTTEDMPRHCPTEALVRSPSASSSKLS